MGPFSMRRRLAVAVATLGLLAVAPGIAAADPPDKLYVDNAPGAHCSDAGAGTKAQPFCTAQAAANVVNPRQTVEISGNQGQTTIQRSGTADAPIVFESGDGIPGMLAGDSDSVPGLVVDGAHDVVVRHLTIRGGTGYAAFLLNTTRVTYDGNTTGGIFVANNSSHLAITRNVISGDIRFSGGVGDNVIAGNEVRGIGHDGIWLDKATGVAVTGNTITGACFMAIGVTGTSTGVSVRNNIAAYIEDGSGQQHCDGSSSSALTPPPRANSRRT